jgi:16S rRNA (guanine966-N2)-methyltransferase
MSTQRLSVQQYTEVNGNRHGMRITGGLYRGRHIYSPKGPAIRPATDRVRESLFAIIPRYIDLEGITILDLFAGTGSLGFECISRGASHAIFVDISRSSIQIMQRTAGELGCLESCTFIMQDALRYIRSASNTFPLIFADPPYAMPSLAALPATIAHSGIIAENGIFIIEHSKRTLFTEDGYSRFRYKEFGETMVSLFSKEQT